MQELVGDPGGEGCEREWVWPSLFSSFGQSEIPSLGEQDGEGWLEESILSVRYLRDIYVGATYWL